MIAQPFASGHILALRRFTTTSIGPAYTSVWHRDPDGRWTFRITGEPHQCCNRYFGSAVDETIRGDIALEWSGSHQLSVTTGDRAVQWTMHLASTPVTRMLSATGGLIPAALWRQPSAPAMTATMAGGMLRTGRMAMRGDLPNGQRFLMTPPSLWTVADTSATLEGAELGPPAPLRAQDHLGDFWLPQRGLFYAGTVQFESYDSTRHLLVATRSEMASSDA